MDACNPFDGKTNGRTKIAQPFKAGLLAHSFQKSCKDDRQVLPSLRDFWGYAKRSPALKCWAIFSERLELPDTLLAPQKKSGGLLTAAA